MLEVDGWRDHPLLQRYSLFCNLKSCKRHPERLWHDGRLRNDPEPDGILNSTSISRKHCAWKGEAAPVTEFPEALRSVTAYCVVPRILCLPFNFKDTVTFEYHHTSWQRLLIDFQDFPWEVAVYLVLIQLHRYFQNHYLGVCYEFWTKDDRGGFIVLVERVLS